MSRKQAINDFCKQCIHDPKGGGTWKDQVTNCPSPKCPLYEYRPRNHDRPLPYMRESIPKGQEDVTAKLENVRNA